MSDCPPKPPIEEPPVSPAAASESGEARESKPPPEVEQQSTDTSKSDGAKVPPPPVEAPPGEGPLLAPPTQDFLACVEATENRWGEGTMRGAVAFALSISLHLFLLAILSVLVTRSLQEQPPATLVIGSAMVEEEELIEEIILPRTESKLRGETLLDPTPSVPEETRLQPKPQESPEVASPLEAALRDPTAATIPLLDPNSNRPFATPTAGPTGGGLEGREGETKSKLIAKYGGTPESELAVAKALRWLVMHQRPDGSWRFDHTKGGCNGRCGNPGTQASTTASTALALLPFLGAGHTSTKGEHCEVVQRGLYYLSGRMLDTPRGGDFQEGTMYAQGLSAIVLCEAYAMTGDPALKKPAQRALDYICYAQHPAGGWRYFPGQPGDMTVTGWQLMALKSGQMAKLEVPSPVIEKARKFLDSMQSYGGSRYGYLKSGSDFGPTAVGLLCRLYMGWHPDDDRIVRGVEFLAGRGPQKEDLYFNYYATQVLHHAQSPEWPAWNKLMRDHLIATQAQTGHEEGSWYFADPHGLTGGRLYSTCFSAMILEVYYRHQPLYEERVVKEGL